MSRHRILARLAPFAASLVLSLACGQTLGQAPRIDRFVVFGASLSDSGNAFQFLSANPHCGARQGVPPYDNLDDLLTPDGPYATGGHHFSNGPTWAEGLARSLALAGNARPALNNEGAKAGNYAVGGARAVPGFPCRFNLPDQVAAYLGSVPRTSPQTLVALEIGGNDVRDALFAAAAGQDPTPFIQNAVASIASSIGALHAHGARRFLLLNMPNAARAPAVLRLDQQLPDLHVAEGALGLTVAFNTAFENFVVPYAKGLGATDVRVLDMFGLLEEIVASPASFGLTNTTDACVTPHAAPFRCQDPDAYVFWDGLHPTRAVHALVARRALAVVSAP
jgi:phospholipase/lecithinase/hemolysin